jgi:hypothetical protein
LPFRQKQYVSKRSKSPVCGVGVFPDVAPHQSGAA